LLGELRGEQYSKTAHRRTLAKLLDDRSDGSVEFKHANISAVLIEFGYPYIAGYKPRWNYQQLLADAVGARLQVDRRLDRAARKAVDAKAEPVAGGDILSRWEPPPDVTDREASGSDQVPEYRLHPRPSVNYLEREARWNARPAIGPWASWVSNSSWPLSKRVCWRPAANGWLAKSSTCRLPRGTDWASTSARSSVREQSGLLR